MLEKNVFELIKNKDGTTTRYVLQSYADNINLCACVGEINLTSYGVSESIVNAMDRAVQVADTAGLEALKDAGIVSGNNY